MLKNVLFIRRIASLNHIIKTKNAPLISSPNSRKYMSLCPCAHLCVAPWGVNLKAIPFHYKDQSGWGDLWTHVWELMSQKTKKEEKVNFLIACRCVSLPNKRASKQVVSSLHFMPFLHHYMKGSMNNRWGRWWDQSEAINLGDRSGQSRM